MVLSVVLLVLGRLQPNFCWVMATFSLGVVGTSYHKPPGIYGSKKLSQFVLRLGEFSWSRVRKQRYCACMASGQVGIS